MRWKGSIGTSFRHIPASLGGYTVGFSYRQIMVAYSPLPGAIARRPRPPGARQYYLRKELQQACSARDKQSRLLYADDKADGSSMIVLATGAP